MLLGCGLFNNGRRASVSHVETTPVAASTPTGLPVPSPTALQIHSGTVAHSPPVYLGPRSLEETIFDSPVIARVRLDTSSSTVESATAPDGSTKYIAILEFSFTTLEYLRGDGENDIVAVWESRPVFDTRQEAEAALPTIAAARDTRWDTHEAIVFLKHSQTYLVSTQQSDRYYLTWKHESDASDDNYSIASRHKKLWLPAETAMGTSSRPSSDQQLFLLDVPSATGSAPTVTLGEMKAKIAAVTAKLAAGDGSEEYRECVERTYLYEGLEGYRIEQGHEGLFERPPDPDLDSGLAAASLVYEQLALGGLPNRRDELWLDGEDAIFFRVEFGESTPHDFSGDGVIDSIQYAQRVVSERPLPAGAYTFNFNQRNAHFVPCEGYTVSHEWTVTVTTPEGTLHEAFFDPVAVGTVVTADNTNGVLKPASFTDSNGATSTVESIAWESGVVKVKVVPWSNLSGHVLDFIELDGTTSLSLTVANSSVDVANHTLSWSVESQPWEDGDKLMLRIRESQPPAPYSCAGGRAVADSAADRALVHDCTALLAARDTLRGEARLNWRPNLVMSKWKGVVTGGAPTRVTRLLLPGEGLNGTIPPQLGSLFELTHLNLRRNSLTGEIPSELGLLANLEALRLSGNDLTGCIPPALEDVPTNDLASLGLPYCGDTPPAFSTSTYAFSVDAGAATGTPVGTVSATSTGGAIAYSISAGDPGGGFAIATTTGRISVAGPLFLEPAPSRALTVRAADGMGGVATTTVRIAVTSVCRNGVVVPKPDANPALVGDCLVLYHGVMRTLAGSASLGWSADSAITGWRGVRVEDGRVRQLLLAEAGLDGSIPPELGRLEGVYRIDLDTNRLTGAIPPQLGDLSNLERLFLFDNDLSGAIPSELGRLKKLKRLDLDTNDLSGKIPSELGGLANLTHLYLHDNKLTGEIPAELADLSALEALYLSGNSLTGEIPARLGELSELTELVLRGNRLSGGIPAELGNLDDLEELWLSDNRLTGAIPPALARLRLERLYLSGNALTGCVPAGLRGATNDDLASLGLPDCANRAPVFATSSYAFSVPENAATSTPVGTVSATDPDEDAVSYSITAGNDGGKFALDAATGALTVAGALDRDTAASHTLTVQAADGNGGVATAAVAVSVTTVP